MSAAAMSGAVSSAVRSHLSALTRLTISVPAPTSDVLRGTERLLLASARTELRASYASLFSKAGGCDAVATGTNTSVSFLARAGLFEDMSRDNDIAYYVVRRGKVGVTDDGQKYSFEKQNNGHKHCIPRRMVSEGEKVRFSSLLMSLACEELSAAAPSPEFGGDATLLTGASVYLDDAVQLNTTTLAECLGNQMRSAAAVGSLDCFFINGADTDEKVDAVREVVKSNEKKMVRLSVPGTTGIYVQDEEYTEVGFDMPAVVMREGEIHEII